MITVALAVTTLVAAFIPGDFQRGLLVGASVVAIFGAVAALTVQATGTAAISMGATAEQWTASELRLLRRAGWHIINHVALQRWDIDHVLIGPGGVIAVETKWSGAGWRLDPPTTRVRDAAAQVRSNARDLRLWHPLRSLGIDSVTAVVFLWGGARPGADEKPSSPVQIDGVDVIYGVRAAKAWRTSIADAGAHKTFEASQIQLIWRALDAHIQRRDSRDDATQHHPTSLLRLYWTGVAATATASIAALISLEALVVSKSWWIWSLSTVLLASTSVAARRARSMRLYSTAWLTGLVGAIVYIAALIIHRTII
jgi:hypothetical protein